MQNQRKDEVPVCSDSDKAKCDSSAEGKLEVTEAMVAAGLDCYASFNQRFDPLEDVLADVYRAMDALRHHERRTPQSIGRINS